MAGEPTMLELLRSRLTDLEARQRATGGAAEGGFWERFAGSMPSPPSESDARSARAGRRARRLAPAARPERRASGPWSGLAAADADSLEQLDLRHPTWLDAAGYEQMVDDPAWVESTSARAEPSASIDEAIVAEASAGLGLTRHAEAELTAAAERVARQRRTHEVTLVTIVSELVSRGIDAPDGLSRTDWLRSHDPSLTAGQAKAFVTVGTALADARWARLRLLVATQQVTVGHAAQIVEFEARTTLVADPADLTTALADLTEQAPRLRPEELARLVRHHSEQVRPPRDEDRLDRGRLEARGLWFTQPNATGMVGLRGVLDPEGAAVLKAAIDPLSIPCPEKDEHGRTVTPDDRTPARRRMDALLTMVQRGVASADGVPTTDKAKVVVLIDLETLVDDVRGTGTTLTGDVLSPGVVRRMACDAEIIPMVLGRDSEPLDVGRSQRLFTRGQRLALVARDHGCSFDGCTVPATWCDAHHVVHWRHGGCTSVDNGALLCPKHHTEVHDRDLTATVTATGVTWHT
ncbi:DUF222 domain-containing protein [Terrabacter sp. 2TAF16]|uniref:HNH endonuclease signature motif containing protein n=1 Tax=Terrabacter sp. 2TAF16 TaxID=3233008 RepID=UPI003F943519